jgi:uncharacterized membrane protein
MKTLWRKFKKRIEGYLINISVKEYIGKHLDSMDQQLLLHENRIDYVLKKLDELETAKYEKH